MKRINGIYMNNWGGGSAYLDWRGMKMLLHGENGTGKSTCVDALQTVFYGRIHQSDYNTAAFNKSSNEMKTEGDPRTYKTYIKGNTSHNGILRESKKTERITYVIQILLSQFFISP